MNHTTVEFRCECGRRYSSTVVVQPLAGPGADEDTVRCNARKGNQFGRACWLPTGHVGVHSWQLKDAI